MSQELKYKVGDRVRVAGSGYFISGRSGVIEEINASNTEYPYWVQFSSRGSWVREVDLTRAASSPDEQDIDNAGGSDPVNHPSHYTSDPSGVECIEITRHRNFNIGSAIKYLWRQGLKQDADKSTTEKQIEDLRKAIWYIQDEIERLDPK